jgi:hypothetical protein
MPINNRDYFIGNDPILLKTTPKIKIRVGKIIYETSTI